MIDNHHLVYVGVIAVFLMGAIAVALATALLVAAGSAIAVAIRHQRRRATRKREAPPQGHEEQPFPSGADMSNGNIRAGDPQNSFR